jgi:hypothetical protein
MHLQIYSSIPFFSVHNSPSYNFTLKYGNRELQKNQERVKLNGLHQVFIYTGVNLLRENIKPIENNVENFLPASKETVKETNVDKPKYMNTECIKNHWHTVIHPNAYHAQPKSCIKDFYHF